MVRRQTKVLLSRTLDGLDSVLFMLPSAVQLRVSKTSAFAISQYAPSPVLLSELEPWNHTRGKHQSGRKGSTAEGTHGSYHAIVCLRPTRAQRREDSTAEACMYGILPTTKRSSHVGGCPGPQSNLHFSRSHTSSKHSQRSCLYPVPNQSHIAF